MRIFRIEALKIVLAAILIFVALGLGMLMVSSHRMTQEIDTRIADIKAQGDPVSVDDLIPRAADPRNGASIYERVFAAIKPGKKDIWNARGVTSPPKRRRDPELLALARAATAKYRGVLPLIGEAASKPYCRFNTNWSDLPEKIIYRYLAEMRDVSRFLSEIAIADASDGRMEDSFRSVGLGYRLSESLNHEPSLIGSLSRIACVSITSLSLKQSAQYGDISESQARGLFDLLGKIDLRSSYIYAMKGERAMNLGWMERIRNYGFDLDPDGRAVPRAGNSRHSRFRSVMNLVSSRYESSCAYELAYLKYMDKVLDIVSQPDRGGIPPEVILDYDPPRVEYMPRFGFDAFSLDRMNQVLYESMSTIAGDRVFLAVMAYKSKYGSYPASLDDTGKKLGWKLPLDPMVGKQFRYRRKGRGFVLYGLGRNLKDDNAVTVEDLPENTRKEGFLEQYPYLDPDGRRSADMIWGKSK